ncbi:hypothetical protein MYSTI_07684 [Myxococcus stipitatus DSM 14675]|uniref:Uncharacterized protein n=1 Tax=Myxococcus stipitatus (strain DSM 14675 / JCM 12634 / Mx s8) TaxID=1278073 RepID=L7UJ14_MYXSD|nr:hypothetical protein [Myxococcus stipitatus]AGC48956.1 hypothetical protein MYSTI_07684 [Myxococcus stipitatus DSM 14675]
MSGEEVVYQSPLLYRVLREADGGLVIEVVVGGIAMDAVRVRLTEREAEDFARDGHVFSDKLARAIMAQPFFGGRAYEPPTR